MFGPDFDCSIMYHRFCIQQIDEVCFRIVNSLRIAVIVKFFKSAQWSPRKRFPHRSHYRFYFLGPQVDPLFSYIPNQHYAFRIHRFFYVLSFHFIGKGWTLIPIIRTKTAVFKQTGTPQSFLILEAALFGQIQGTFNNVKSFGTAAIFKICACDAFNFLYIYTYVCVYVYYNFDNQEFSANIKN